MTFKLDILIRSSDDARLTLETVGAKIAKAGLSPQAEQLLSQQVTSAVEQFARQLSLTRAHSISASRVFEGDGYRATVRVKQRSDGLLEKIKQLLGSR